VEIQTLSGDVDEIDAADWEELPLALAEAPDDMRSGMDDLEAGDVGDSDYESPPQNLTQPPEPLGIEAWDDTRPNGDFPNP
jgi:hypothetical protein